MVCLQIYGKDSFQVLGVGATATQQEIRKAYHKLALRLHPDKNKDDEEAKEKFQQLQKVISILGDEVKRAVYDQTGSVDDAALLLNALLGPHCKDIIDEAIAAGEVKSTKAYKKWAKEISEIKPPTSPQKMRQKKAKASAEIVENLVEEVVESRQHLQHLPSYQSISFFSQF